MGTVVQYLPTLTDIEAAADALKGVAKKTPLMYHANSSEKYRAQVFLKREDLQKVRSYKIRGAYHKINGLTTGEQKRGVVCASAGNHAQGVAYACRQLGIKATIFMPVPTPKQKVEQVAYFGGQFVEIVLAGDTFDDASLEAQAYGLSHESCFIHPFDDEKVIEGQGTVGLEILQAVEKPVDYLFLPVGGGGLAAGVSTVFKALSPHTKVIGVEPAGAPSMKVAFENGKNERLISIDNFVDGAAVKQVGDKTFSICKEKIDGMATVHEGKICQALLELYSKDAIVAEPAGAMSLAVLDQYSEEIVGKTVVCVLSGGNNDISRTEEIRERSLLYQGLKHYFMVRFPQRAGALKEFVANVLGPTDDIVHFEYTKKTSREKGSAVVGVELKAPSDFELLVGRMKHMGFFGEYLNENPALFAYLV